MVARSVVDVILGEAVSGTRAERYEDMLAIASVIENRARAMGITPEQVVGKRSEFNAYGDRLPAGVNAYRQLAEQALAQVRTTGPVHNAMFYATPPTVKNLPDGLRRETQTRGHVYLSDPQRRSINSAVGLRQVRDVAPTAMAYASSAPQRGATAAIGGLLAGAPQNVPTPTSAPRGLLAAAQAPVPANVPIPSPVINQRTGNNVYDRMRGYPVAGRPSVAPQAMLDRYASTRPTPNSPVSAPPATKEARVLSREQEANLAGRLGPVEAPRTATTIGGLLGVTPAAAATMTPELARANQQVQTATAPARQSPSIGSPRALEAMGAPPLDPVAQALAPLPTRDVSTRQVASVPGPVAPQQTQARSAPAISAPSAPAMTSYTAPAAAYGGAGYATSLPSAPAAPSRGLLSGISDWAGNNRGMVTGGLLGGTLAGPIGMIAGGLLGRAFQTPEIGGGEASPSAAAQAALNAGWGGFGPMTAAQERAAYSAMGGSSRDNAPSQAAQDAARGGKAGGLF